MTKLFHLGGVDPRRIDALFAVVQVSAEVYWFFMVKCCLGERII